MTTSTVQPVGVAHQLPSVCRLLATHGSAALPTVLGLVGRAIGAVVLFQPTSSPANLTLGAVPSPRRTAGTVELPVATCGRVFGALVVPDPLPTEPDAEGRLELLRAAADALALTLAGAPSREGAVAAAALLRLEEDERRELAHQLHDSLVQSLIAARYLSDLAHRSESLRDRAGPPDGDTPDADAPDAAAPVREAVQAALHDGRHLLAQLRPRALDGSGLLPALRSLLPDDDADRVVVDLAVPAQLPDVAGVAAFRFVQAAVADLLARGLEPGLVHATLVRGNLELWVRGEPARTPSVAYPWASCSDSAPGPSSALALTRWGHRLRLLGGGTRLDELSAHAWLPLSDGSPTASAPAAAARATRGRHQGHQGES